MARRTLTIKRIDPWSVLKVGFLANLVLLGILLLTGRVVWFFIERLELIGRACEVAESVGFQDCGLNGGNIFRSALLLGLLGVVGQTGILVFVAFLHNLISELTGGLSVTVVDDQPEVASARPAAASGARPGPAPVARGAQQTEAVPARSTAPVGASASAAPRPASLTEDQAARPASARPAQAPSSQQPSGPQPGQARPSGDPTQVAPRTDGQGNMFPGRPPQDPSRPHGPSRP